MSRTRFTPEYVGQLKENEIFVFGSNLAGIHAGGAANTAYRLFGAKWGVGEGLQGRSYALPTMQGSLERIAPYVDKFIDFAASRSDLTFLVTPVGTGIAGYSAADMGPLFERALDMENVILPRSFAAAIVSRNKLIPTYNPADAVAAYSNMCLGLPGSKKEMRHVLREIYAGTVRIVEKGRYVGGNYPDLVTVELPDPLVPARATVFYTAVQPVDYIPARSYPTTVSVLNDDCLDVARALVRQGYLPAVLNFASATTPGGGVENGSAAQEESIFRRSNLFVSLLQFTDDFNRDCSFYDGFGISSCIGSRAERYPIRSPYGAIYTPGVTVFRANDAAGFALLAEPFRTAVITAAAINRPELDRDNRLTAEDAAITLETIRTVLRVALRGGHDALVLGAFGCGAFHNPPAHIAELFKEALAEPEFADKLRTVIFSILDRGATSAIAPEGNFAAFEAVFGNNES